MKQLKLSRNPVDRAADIANGLCRCAGCPFYRTAHGTPEYGWLCHYAIDTGELRPIRRPADCYAEFRRRLRGQ